jgi:zinc transport system substrate-binding protein
MKIETMKTTREGHLYYFRGVFSTFCIFLLLFLLGGASLARADSKLKVVTTLFPLQEFAKAVGGENVVAEMILPPGIEPHAWEPKASDLAKIQQADVFLYIGPIMELWAADILKAVGGSGVRVVEASRGLTLLEAKNSQPVNPKSRDAGRSGRIDPHIWLDFSLDQAIIDSVAAVFAEKDPGRAAQYRANSEAYKRKLQALDKEFQSALSPCRHREIILGGHSAFAYLATRYGLRQVPLYGVSPNAEPTPKKLTEVIKAARTYGVKYIFFEELVNPKLARVLAAEADLQTLVLNDGANVTRDQLSQKVTFLGLMEKNLDSLRKGLDCGTK